MKKGLVFIVVFTFLAMALPCHADGGTPLPCNWTMTVSGTDQRNVEGFVFDYSLELNAEKAGGTTDQGSYTGTARLKMNFDASQTSKISGIAVAGFVDMDLSADEFNFDVVAYDEEAYSAFGGENSLAPLSAYDSMALFDLTLKTTGDQDVSSGLGQVTGEYIDEQSTLPMKILIDGGQVTISIDVPWFYGTFHGMVTGTPQ
jgi:hypothetical protein